jgi:hypothetical protein
MSDEKTLDDNTCHDVNVHREKLIVQLFVAESEVFWNLKKMSCVQLDFCFETWGLMSL